LTAALLLSSSSRQTDTGACADCVPYLDVSLVSVAAGFDQPTVITHAGDGRLFIVEQAGVIRIIDERQRLARSLSRYSGPGRKWLL
jgi:hypothetical protein